MRFSVWRKKKRKIIVASAGRDGSVSVANLLQEFSDMNGLGLSVCHEYMSREFHHEFSNSKKSDGAQSLSAMEEMAVNCDYDIIVGSGCGLAIGYFKKHFDVTLIHLKRSDRDSAISSLIKNAESFPMAYGNYIESSGSRQMGRFTAVDLGECSQRSWEEMTLRDKIAFYYDRKHSIIEKGRPKLTVNTETLSDLKTIKKITALIDPSAKKIPFSHHANLHFSFSSMSELENIRIQRIFSKLNFAKLAADDQYFLDYCLNHFVSYVGWQITKHEVLDEQERLAVDQISELIEAGIDSLSNTIGLMEQLAEELRSSRQ